MCGYGYVFGILIRIHKVAKYRSNSDPDPSHCFFKPLWLDGHAPLKHSRGPWPFDPCEPWGPPKYTLSPIRMLEPLAGYADIDCVVFLLGNQIGPSPTPPPHTNASQ